MKNILYQHTGSWENEIFILCLVYIAVGLIVIETIELKEGNMLELYTDAFPRLFY
jgi:hypothetical protein